MSKKQTVRYQEETAWLESFFIGSSRRGLLWLDRGFKRFSKSAHPLSRRLTRSWENFELRL